MKHHPFGIYLVVPGPRGRGRSGSFSGYPPHRWFSHMMCHGQRAERGEVRYLILDALSDKPRHGYDVIREIEKRSEGIYMPSTGTVYPTLQMLEESGLVRSHEEGGRKLYELTGDGRRELEENREEVDDTYERLCWHSSLSQVENFQAMGEQVERMFRSLRRSFQRGQIDSRKMDDISLVLEGAENRIEGILKGKRDD